MNVMSDLRLQRLRAAVARPEHREKMRKLMKERLAAVWRPSGPKDFTNIVAANRRNLPIPEKKDTEPK